MGSWSEGPDQPGTASRAGGEHKQQVAVGTSGAPINPRLNR